MNRSSPIGGQGQRGAVLLVGLIMLAILTLIGTSGMGTVTMEERMVSNMQNANKAFQGAEAVLAECEDFIRSNDFAALENDTSNSLSDVAANTHRIVEVGAITESEWWNDKSWWANNGVDSAVTDMVKAVDRNDGLVQAPQCITEFVGNGASSQDAQDLYAGAGTTPGDKLLYKVTGYSKGADDSSEAVVESLFYKQ